MNMIMGIIVSCQSGDMHMSTSMYNLGDFVGRKLINYIIFVHAGEAGHSFCRIRI